MRYLILLSLTMTVFADDYQHLKKNVKFQSGSEVMLWQHTKKTYKKKDPFIVKMICIPNKDSVSCTYMETELYSTKSAFTSE